MMVVNKGKQKWNFEINVTIILQLTEVLIKKEKHECSYAVSKEEQAQLTERKY